MAFKIGNIDISYFKVGGSDCSIYLGNTLLYSGGTPPTPPTPSYDTEYLTFVAEESGTFTFTPQNSNVISYSTDNGSTWTQGNSVSVSANDKILWKATLTPTSNGIGKFSSSGNFTVEGNIMSLLYGDNFSGQTSLSGKDYTFAQLFDGCTGMTSAENLVLPATTLGEGCYSYMFYGCTSLTTAPSLPATTLAEWCYDGMFYNCTSLTTAPQLPATTLLYDCYRYMFARCSSLTTAPTLSAVTLADYCYYGMFQGCTSLTTAPVLPATTLAEWCYNSMFFGCTSLNSITCLATDISASECTTNWVYGVASNGTFTKAASMNDWPSGDNGIPNGWTVENYSG